MWWTGETGRMEWHSYVGYTLVVLVTTRLVWGVVGSFHSRFVNFVRGPSAVLKYIQGAETKTREATAKGDHNGERDRGSLVVGHNPLGAYSTLALLSVLLLQGISGMFSIDDLAFDGPLAYYLDGEFIDFTSQWHETGWSVLQALIALHLIAIAWYQLKKRQPLVQTMWFGRHPSREAMHRPIGIARAILVVAIVVTLLTIAINLAPEPPSYY